MRNDLPSNDLSNALIDYVDELGIKKRNVRF